MLSRVSEARKRYRIGGGGGGGGGGFTPIGLDFLPLPDGLRWLGGKLGTLVMIYSSGVSPGACSKNSTIFTSCPGISITETPGRGIRSF